ncbi:MAG: DUF4197 domain-containing protein [Novosphingobium sp.]|nr:DUF4197 domain-containing protein [Novosphingobium sp.]
MERIPTIMMSNPVQRRLFLGGIAAVGLIALPGCASFGQVSLVDAVRRLLALSARNAFARLTEPDGFWDSAVARVNLPVLFGKRGSIVQGILSSGPFRERLQHKLNNVAEDGARRAAPVVTDAVKTIGVENAVAILNGGPTAATTLLRDEMGPALVNAMIPALDDALRVANDPLVNQAISALAGVDLGMVAHGLALEADNAIWYQIGREEAAIRADPESTNDPVLIAALKVPQA